jgi:prolyl-tRNA editing enzyme YbaK/EbsC (Cys-tRNA(Pro) deacylase)
MTPLTPDDVQNAIDQFDKTIRIRFFDASTATSQQAADAIGCLLGQIVKSLAFLIDEKPILILASGDGRVDDKKLAVLFDVSRKKIKTASAEQCIAIYGYAPGGVPPIGIRTGGIPVYIDQSLERFEQVYAAAGAHNAIFPITRLDLINMTGGQVVDIRKEDTPTE